MSRRFAQLIAGLAVCSSASLASIAFALFYDGAGVAEPIRAPSPTPASSGQKLAAAEKPVPQEPTTQSTTATYGDWTLRCQQAGAPPQGRRSCEVFQSVMVQNQSAPFAQIAFGKPTPEDTLHVTVVVPVNVSFPNRMRIAVDENDAQAAELNFTRCVPTGCFASAGTKEDTLKRWRPLTTAGRVTFKNAAGQEVTMPISFRGLAQALDALAKER
jgi:invasion protein IalB